MAGHEPGPFSSVRRPRETLGPINQNTSAIPMPSSAMKRSNSVSNMQPGAYPSARAGSVSGQRMSLAPGRPPQPNLQRTSSGSNLADMGMSTVQRTSSGNMFSSTNGRKSLAPGGFSTPAHSLQPNPMQQSTQRRSSVYSARQSSSMAQLGHQSFFTQAPVPAGVPKDPRPLRDRSFQTQIGQELLDYLTHNNFEMDMKHSLTQNTMRSPTQKDFNYMFQWLYHRVDPNYRFQKDIPAEVPPILKQLRYPFEKNITKSQLSAVGGNNWPTFLGMLHWMMQLARMMDGFSAGTYDDACIEAGHDISGDRVVFNFLSGAYHEWLAMEDDQDDKEVLKPHVEEMASKFDAANARYLEQVRMLEAENKSLEDQIEELDKSGPKIRKLDEDIKVLEDDLNKFETYRNEVESRLPSRKTKIEMLESEITKVEAELEEAQKTKSELQEAVDKQGIAIADIDRMNAERERLQRGIDATAERLEESKRKVSDKENDGASRLDTLERTVHEYNSLGYQLSMIPSTATNAKGQEYELSLQVNSAPDFRSSRTRSSEAPDQDQHQPDRLLADPSNGYAPQHLLNLDVRGAIKNGIVALRKEVSARRNAAAEADMGNRDMLDGIKEAIEDKMQEVEGLRHRVRGAEEEFEKTREMQTTQKLATDAQTEKLEKELARMRTTLTESVQLMEQREMNTNIEYEQLTLRAAALREELHTNVEKMLNDVIRFKVHVQKALEEYEGFVAGEVEGEWGALEGAGEDTNTAGFEAGEGDNTRNLEEY